MWGPPGAEEVFGALVQADPPFLAVAAGRGAAGAGGGDGAAAGSGDLLLEGAGPLGGNAWAGGGPGVPSRPHAGSTVSLQSMYPPAPSRGPPRRHHIVTYLLLLSAESRRRLEVSAGLGTAPVCPRAAVSPLPGAVLALRPGCVPARVR